MSCVWFTAHGTSASWAGEERSARDREGDPVLRGGRVAAGRRVPAGEDAMMLKVSVLLMMMEVMMVVLMTVLMLGGSGAVLPDHRQRPAHRAAAREEPDGAALRREGVGGVPERVDE
eukprot:3170449-Rhodomonas_salina.1